MNQTHLGVAWCRALGSVFLLLASGVTGPRGASAQVKYDPEDPFVQELIAKGVSNIEASPPSGLGPQIMAATAIYKARVYTHLRPKEHPIIERAAQSISRAVNNPSMLSSGAEFNPMYVPALATIFLLEIDAEKYENEITILLDFIETRQQNAGAWGYRKAPNVGDTSQMQYVCLALWLADKSNYRVSPEVGRRALDWLITNQESGGGWIYHYPPGAVPGMKRDTEVRHSLVAAGAGSVYVLSDWLRLNPPKRERAKNVAVQREDDLELRLPPSVREARTGDGRPAPENAAVKFDMSRLTGAMQNADQWFQSNFDVSTKKYNYYYLYGFERYASLHELVTGHMNNVPTWYDRGVEFLAREQQEDGGWPSDTAAGGAVSTAFAILFLTRSMQITINDRVQGSLIGGEGFKSKTKLRRSRTGDLVGEEIERDVSDLLSLLDDPTDSELDEFADSLTVLKLDGDNGSRSQQLVKLRMLVTHRKWQARIAAVRFLAKQRDLDNVPALIYALTDPEMRVAREANQGLRFISRKIDEMTLSEKPGRAELLNLKQAWTDWYLSIRPDAQLLD